MYIPLSFMGGNNVIASCNCNNLYFEVTATGSQWVNMTYQPCNAETIVTERYTGISTNNICIAERNYSYTGPGLVTGLNLDTTCLQSNCQSCDCYEFFYRTAAGNPTYISYIPCGAPSSSREIIGPFSPSTTGSFSCSFPWTVITISGSLDYPSNGPSGVVKQINSGSCQPFVSGTLSVGDLRGGGMVIYVTGSYPNQSGLIITTQSVATSSADFSRWGFYGTQTNINDQSYGTGLSNTQALRNYTPATGSIAANALTASINGYSDWFLPSVTESVKSAQNGIGWPVTWNVPYPRLDGQPQLWRNTKGESILTSNEYIGTTAQMQQRAYVIPSVFTGNKADVLKNVTGTPLFGYRYFTSSLA